MKKLAIIGANDFQKQFIEKANGLGYETYVFAWADGAVGADVATKFYPISIVEKEQILEECRKIGIDGVCSIASDLAVPTINYVAEGLGLTGNDAFCSLASTNKYAMRQVLADAGLPVPLFTRYEKAEDVAGFALPLIVKPSDRSGSRGVEKIERWEDLEPAVAAAKEVSLEKCAVVEEYVEGEEFSVEFVSWEGKHTYLTATRKYTNGAPHFVEVAHHQPVDWTKETEANVIDIITRSLDALHVKYGASHSEIRIDEQGKINIIEIGSRMGGGCIGSDLVPLSTGYDFMKMVIDISLGKAPDFTKICTPAFASSRFILSEEDLAEMQKLEEDHPGWVVRKSPMEKIDSGEATSSVDRWGYYIISIDDEDEIKQYKADLLERFG